MRYRVVISKTSAMPCVWSAWFAEEPEARYYAPVPRNAIRELFSSQPERGIPLDAVAVDYQILGPSQLELTFVASAEEPPHRVPAKERVEFDAWLRVVEQGL
jgi:hypothetical protein